MNRFLFVEGVTAAAILAVTLSGCASPEIQADSCSSYVHYDSLEDAAAEATLVARATVTHAKNPLEIRLVDVVKGGFSSGDSVVVSALSTCDPVEAPQGSQEVVVLLVQRGNAWAPINPDQGLRAFNNAEFSSLR